MFKRIASSQYTPFLLSTDLRNARQNLHAMATKISIDRLEKEHQNQAEHNHIKAILLKGAFLLGCIAVIIASPPKSRLQHTALCVILGLFTYAEIDKQLNVSIEHFIPYPPKFTENTITNMNTLRTYIKTIIQTPYYRALKIANGLEIQQLKDQHDAFETSFSVAEKQVSKANFQQVLDSFDALHTQLNTVLSRHSSHYRYPIDTPHAWENNNHALSQIQELIKDSTRYYSPSNHRDTTQIPRVSLSQCSIYFPKTLTKLIQNIYNSWTANSFIDERTTTQVNDKSSTTPIPGAIRCAHLNDNGALPDISNLPTPPNGKPLEQHLLSHSKLSHNMAHKKHHKTSSEPQGYAEYTGVGISNDAHHVRLVFDYKQGIIYLSVTHYCHWLPGTPPTVPHPPTIGTQNPFIAIDMT